MSNPLFLLGAGFNFDIDCGYPLSRDLFNICFPDKENGSTRSIEELLDASIKKKDFKPVKLIYDKIMEADYNLIRTLNQHPSNCYATFFNKFKESSFLTFNYDSLTELFLLKLGQWYPHDGYGVPVETSFNWNIESHEKKKREYLKKRSTSLVLHLHGSLFVYIKDFEKRNNQIKFKQNPTFKFDPGPLRHLFLAYERGPLDLSYKRHEERVIVTLPQKLCRPKVEISGFMQPPESAVWRTRKASSCSANYVDETRCNRFAMPRS